MRLVSVAHDDIARLDIVTKIELGDALSVRVELTNACDHEPYLLHGLSVTLPIPRRASELQLFSGRWARELHPVRVPWHHGSHTVENRRGRTSHEHPPLVFAGTPGFGEWNGSVWGAHLAWSGNHALLAERLADGRRYLQFSELLHPGEIVLEPGASYVSPEVVAVCSDAGLTAATQQFHRRLRRRPSHPRLPRPVLFNTWEAVYFDHDLHRLRALADRAERIGTELFVLDDGWFGSRRDDTSSLGDWTVSRDAHPAGLRPLIEHVRGLGMRFGIWVEPEMISPDSDLYRCHPQWAMTTDGHEPVTMRHQLVLDLARPDAYDHVLERLDALLSDYDISYLKWDMNRDHIAAAGADGAAGTHAQTVAVYQMMDELHKRHPHVEIESCASGGARIDHEILRYTTRVWTSDCNDPLERQTIQRGASMLIPPEMMGAHIGPARSHTTGRHSDLAFRAATAFFGHLGVECDLMDLDEDDLDDLRAAIDAHRRLRPLLHSGDVVRFDTEDAYIAHGVYSPDRSEAVVSFAAIATASSATPPRLRLPGLDSAVRYRLDSLQLFAQDRRSQRGAPALPVGLAMRGDDLGRIGMPIPSLDPQTALLVYLHADDEVNPQPELAP